MPKPLDWIIGSEIMKRWDMKPTDLFYTIANHKIRVMDIAKRSIENSIFQRYTQGTYRIESIANEMISKTDFKKLDETYRASIPRRNQFIYGKNLKRRWNKNETEMFILVSRHGLTAVDRFGCKIPFLRLIAYHLDFIPNSKNDQIFLLTDVEKFEKEYPELKNGKKIISYEVLKLMENAKPELDTIFGAIKRIGFSARVIEPEPKWKAAALIQFDLEPEKYSCIKRSFLENISLYAFSDGQNKRDFYGRILQLIIEDHGLGKYNYQVLYESYKRNID